MNGVFVKVAILFSLFVISVLAEDSPLIVTGSGGKPPNISSLPAIDDTGTPSPFFSVDTPVGITMNTPPPQDSTTNVIESYAALPTDSRLTRTKKKRERTEEPSQTKHTATTPTTDAQISAAISGVKSRPSFGSPPPASTDTGPMKKSHTMLLSALENLGIPSTPPPPSTGDAPGDLSESTALSTEDDDED